MNSTLSSLIDRLSDSQFNGTNVIPWSSPVPSFGDLPNSRVATLGLNPSNREFVDRSGRELHGASRRFHTLKSLGITRWSDATKHHLEMIIETCCGYFTRNPYDGWFKQLDNIISGTKASYYNSSTKACHLDLIPYATACKWTDLARAQQSTLLALAGDTLGHLLGESPVRVLILNGNFVVEQFQIMAATRLEKQAMSGWALGRRGRPSVTGYAFKGAVRQVAGVKFDRDILVLGFNHNIQSSFGVTNEVRTAIRQWIANAMKEIEF